MNHTRYLFSSLPLVFFSWASIGADGCVWPGNPTPCTPDATDPTVCASDVCPAGYVMGAGGGGSDDGVGGDVGAGGGESDGDGAGGSPGAGFGVGAGDSQAAGVGGGEARSVPHPPRRVRRHHRGGLGTAVSAQCVAVTGLPPICRTDPPRFCAALCPFLGSSKPTLTGACAEDNAGTLEALFADDVKDTLDCADAMYPSVSYVVNPTYFSITPVEVPLGVKCNMPPAPPPTQSFNDWIQGGGS